MCPDVDWRSSLLQLACTLCSILHAAAKAAAQECPPPPTGWQLSFKIGCHSKVLESGLRVLTACMLTCRISSTGGRAALHCRLLHAVALERLLCQHRTLPLLCPPWRLGRSPVPLHSAAGTVPVAAAEQHAQDILYKSQNLSAAVWDAAACPCKGCSAGSEVCQSCAPLESGSQPYSAPQRGRHSPCGGC